MDTTNNYFVMCKAATEIQALWKPQIQDCIKFYLKQKHQFIKSINGEELLSKRKFKKEEATWMPFLSQLTDIYYDTQLEVKADMFVFVHNGVETYLRYFKSEAQFYLGFIMWELYNKKWSGKLWE